MLNPLHSCNISAKYKNIQKVDDMDGFCWLGELDLTLFYTIEGYFDNLKSLMTLMTLTLMTAFHVSSATFKAYFPVLQCFCNKLLIENDRKYYLSATYVIFGIES